MSEGFIGTKRTQPMVDQFGNPIDSNAELKKKIQQNMQEMAEPVSDMLRKKAEALQQLMYKQTAPVQPPQDPDAPPRGGLTEQEYKKGSALRQQQIQKMIAAEQLKNSDNMLPTTKMNQPKSEYASDLSDADYKQLIGEEDSKPKDKLQFKQTNKLLGK